MLKVGCLYIYVAPRFLDIKDVYMIEHAETLFPRGFFVACGEPDKSSLETVQSFKVGSKHQVID